jgi:anaerobic selenocysteine-containing dehydrogenase
LPHHIEPPESPISTPDLAKEYPLILITGGKNIVYFHSEGRQITALRKMMPEPIIEVHPETARKLGINEGEYV